MLVLIVGCSSEPPAGTQTPAVDAAPETVRTVLARETQAIVVDGSSTVYPLTVEANRRYGRQRQTAEVIVNFSGTRGGFRAFCQGETDIQNASRPIITEEIEACQTNGVTYIEIPIAMDALSLVVHPDNTWADSLTVEELRQIWAASAEGQVTRWSQVRSDWPDQPLVLLGRGQDSGTYDYFTQVILGEVGASRKDYIASEDVDFLVAQVSQEPNALAFFGIGHFLQNWEDLKSVAVDSGNGPVYPELEAVRKLEYRPLSRPLFLYVNADTLTRKPQVQSFISAYLDNPQSWIPLVGYLPLSDRAYDMVRSHLQQKQTGTAFQGQVQATITIEEAMGSFSGT
ncbi:phosphate ABC transporter substrate-binding protein PstS family protein [Synechococcales cyanobacterium C]|uniref:Phosphate-binding protein n=2 Tax=Petrachloros TaxID=2918834 RepID=A0A8K2ANA4_9CYAN|nr:phosphate ABC transporter substrate-binding protein PstS family protein [Petrachloros mirabilis ULC683]